jgi:hypothetical protein
MYWVELRKKLGRFSNDRINLTNHHSVFKKSSQQQNDAVNFGAAAIHLDSFAYLVTTGKVSSPIWMKSALSSPN